jgi:hypothetical protein
MIVIYQVERLAYAKEEYAFRSLLAWIPKPRTPYSDRPI